MDHTELTSRRDGIASAGVADHTILVSEKESHYFYVLSRTIKEDRAKRTYCLAIIAHIYKLD